jgi:hypothetical protein
MKKPNSYIRFLNLVEVMATKSKIRSLDSIEKMLLNQIMVDDDLGNLILVGDLLNLSSFGSQATLHGRLKNLHSIGYIQLIEQEDARKKRDTPTNKAYKRIALLSDCMVKATQ